MNRVLIGIVTLFIIGTGYGALNATTPHNYTQDAYRAEALRSRATSTPHSETTRPIVQKPPLLPIKNGEKSIPEPAQTSTSPTQKGKDVYSFTVHEAGTALSSMEREQGRGLVFTTKRYPSLGEFIESIGGLQNNDGKYWILYINGATSTTGASNARVIPGDVVTWRYEAGY